MVKIMLFLFSARSFLFRSLPNSRTCMAPGAGAEALEEDEVLPKAVHAVLL